jgi:hypothetical protein
MDKGYLRQQGQGREGRGSSVTSGLSSKTARLAPGPGLGHCNCRAMRVQCPFGRAQWRKGLHPATSCYVVDILQAREYKGREGATGNNQKFITAGARGASAPPTWGSPANNQSRRFPCRPLPTKFHMFHPVTSNEKLFHVISEPLSAVPASNVAAMPCLQPISVLRPPLPRSHLSLFSS